MKSTRRRSRQGLALHIPLGVATLLALACSSEPSVDGVGTTGGGGATSGSAGTAPATGGSAPQAGAGGSAGGKPSTAGSGGDQGGGGSASGGGAGGGGAGGGMPTAGAGGGGSASGGTGGAAGAAGNPGLPDPGTEGDGDSMVGPNYTTQPDLTDRGNPKGKSFTFSMPLSKSTIFDGKDPTLDPGKVSSSRSINVYIPAKYKDGDAAPVLVIQDGPGELGMVKNALDNLTASQDATRKLPAFVAIAVQNGGNDAIGSERGLEYDTLSDRYARFIEMEVMPAVRADSAVKAAYPNLRFTKHASGRAALGCSSGGAAAFTMAWFRPDLFSRVIAYSTTLVAQQDPKAPEAADYPLGAWEYHSSKRLIEGDTTRKPLLRLFINVNENDLRSTDAESTHHNWVMANQRTAAALKTKGFHYKFVQGKGVGHCDGGVRNATLADALVWAWRGYEPATD